MPIYIYIYIYIYWCEVPDYNSVIVLHSEMFNWVTDPLPQQQNISIRGTIASLVSSGESIDWQPERRFVGVDTWRTAPATIWLTCTDVIAIDKRRHGGSKTRDRCSWRSCGRSRRSFRQRTSSTLTHYSRLRQPRFLLPTPELCNEPLNPNSATAKDGENPSLRHWRPTLWPSLVA